MAEAFELRCELWMPRERGEIFPFFADAFNLARITPPELGFIVKTPPPINIQTGTVIDYTIRWLGIPLKWRTLIEAYEPPVRFVDTALKSPYALWHHTHTFEPVRGGTLCVDVVKYRIPFGPVGRMMNAIMVRRQLEHIFTYRQAKLQEYLLGKDAGKAVELLSPTGVRREF